MMVRVQQDADDLQRAVHSFVLEAQKQYSKTAFQELNTTLGRKRLRGVYVVTHLGIGIPGAGAAALWKGLGYIALHGLMHQPRQYLSQEILDSLGECQLALKCLTLLDQSRHYSSDDYGKILVLIYMDTNH